MRRPTLLRWLCCAGVLCLSEVARADNLDVRGWLDRPGVKLLAVEFYATWCKPCMEAVPRWKALHERYRRDGLRLVVVATQDPQGGCVNPGWNPDDTVCDEDGVIARALGAAERLPSAFLWSWQGNLLIRQGHVDEVEGEIVKWMKATPRLDIEVKDVAKGAGIERAALLALVRSDVERANKLVIIATKQERDRLNKLKLESLKAGYDDAMQCEIGRDVSANSLLDVHVTGSEKRKRLQLTLLSAERGCLEATSVVDWDPSSASQSVAEAVAALVAKLRREVQYPRGQGTAARPPAKGAAEEKAIGDAVEDWTPEGGGERVVVSFASTPPGAVVTLDGSLLCQDTSQGCSKAIPAGTHQVAMQKERYQKRSERLEVKKGTKIDWKLDPDFGFLDVKSDPPGVDVKVNGQVVGKSPLQNHELSPGTYEVLVGDACFYGAGKQVAIERNARKTVEVSLKTREGAIDLSAEAAGNDVEADVLVDGKKMGVAPGVLKVPVCAKKVEVLHAKYGRWEKEIKVEEKKTLRVKAVLDGGSSGGVGGGGEVGKAGITWVHSRPANLYFAKTETTVLQYRGCVDAGACQRVTIGAGAACNFDKSGRDDHPMNCVSWFGADAFCQWAGGRLPTENEWESEASNGGQRAYPWGTKEAICERAIMNDEGAWGCGRESTWSVCSKPKGNSISGACDMSGNVWEWTASEESGSRVIRGGSWRDGGQGNLRASGRDGYGSNVRDDTFGFRCVSVSVQ